MEGLPGRVIGSVPGPTSEPTRTVKTIHTIHSLIDSNKVVMVRMIMMPNDIRGIMWSLKLPHNCFKVRKNRRTSPKRLVQTGNRTRARCVTGAHATSCSRAVDPCTIISTLTMTLKFPDCFCVSCL